MPLLSASANPGVASWTADGDGLVLGSGGNARGTAAVDLQTVRSSDDRVASGNYSGVLWGENCLASGYHAGAGGNGNQAAGNSSTALGGRSNRVGIWGYSATGAVISGGRGGEIGQAADADYAAIVGGLDNIVNGYYAGVFGGYTNTASGESSTILGGRYNEVQAANSGAFASINSYIDTTIHEAAIVAGDTCRVYGAANHGRIFLGGGRNNYVQGNTSDVAVVGSYSHYLNGCDAVGVLGSWTNTLDNCFYSAVVGSYDTYMNGSGVVALGSANCTIVGTSNSATLAAREAFVYANVSASLASNWASHSNQANYSVTIGVAPLAEQRCTFALSGNAQSPSAAQQGRSQLQLLHLDARTVGAATQVMYADTHELLVPTNGALHVLGRVMAWNETTGRASYWNVDVLVHNAGAGAVIDAQVPAAGAQLAVAKTAGEGNHLLTVAASTNYLRFSAQGVTDLENLRWSGAFTVARAMTAAP